jgi:hypothetical protein
MSMRWAGVVKSCCVLLLMTGLASRGAAQNSPGGAVYGDTVPHGSAVVYPEQLYQDESHYGVIKIGPVNVHPNITAGLTYDDNLNIKNVNRVDDFYFDISPGFRAIIGENRDKFISLTYHPRIIVFAQEDQNNSVDQDANLLAQWHFNKLTLAAGQGFQLYSGNEIDAGARVDRKSYITTLGAIFNYSEKTSFELNLRQTIADYGTSFSDFNEWVASPYMNYQITDKVKLGLGVTAGFLDTRSGPNQTYEQGLVRAVYKLTEKIDARAQVGAEIRQFQNGGDDGPTPVLSIGATYRPREKTQLGLGAYRRQQNSVSLTNQNYEVTGVNASINQQLREKLSASLLAGYDYADYKGTLAGVAANRVDKYYYLQAGLNFQITPKWSAGAFYTHRHNDSKGTGSTRFTNNQVGLQTTLWY